MHMTIRTPISRTIAWLEDLRLGRPAQVLFFGHGIGDDLLCTAVARELKKRGTGRIVMFSRHPALFEKNPDVAAVYGLDHATIGRRRRWGYPSVVPYYASLEADGDREKFHNEHFIVTMCRMAGVRGTVDLRPYLTLEPEEKTGGQRLPNQVAILSAGRAQMKNKNWFPERYQAVVDALADSFNFIQLGVPDDPPLRGVLDLRGRTNLRESAAILASSRVFIGQVGFLMHLARAVECRSVIVYGGRETPLVDGYAGNENLTGPMPCSPCWQRNRCDFDRECMRMIEPEAVIAAFHRQLAREDEPLPVGQATVTDCYAEISKPLASK